MKTSVVLLSLFFAIATALDRRPGRALLQKHACPQFTGPRHLEDEVQIQITYLHGDADIEHSSAYDGLLDLPMGTLFGKATVYFSSPPSVAMSPKYFRISKFPGAVLGGIGSDDNCTYELHFIVQTTCHDSCVPSGICLEIDNILVKEETGYDLPFRKHCMRLERKNRPSCLYVSWEALQMVKSENDVMAHTSDSTTQMLLLLSVPFKSFLDFKPEDFTISGPNGTMIESVKAAVPGHATNVAYTIVVKHGESEDDAEIKICLVGAATLSAVGIPYKNGDGICASYLKTVKESNDPGSLHVIYKSTLPKFSCPSSSP